jgi:hypothetical protein
VIGEAQALLEQLKGDRFDRFRHAVEEVAHFRAPKIV